MWQSICICLPAITLSEQQRLFARFGEIPRTYASKPGEMDIGLFFLHSLSPAEALTVLEERLDLVIRSQELMRQQQLSVDTPDVFLLLIDDHLRTLLGAEHEWLERAISQIKATNRYINEYTANHTLEG